MSSSDSSMKAAIPYAEALFELSKYIQSLEKTSQDLNLVKTTIDQSHSLQSFLVNPLIAMNIKKNVMKNIFIDQVSTNVLNFLFILIERRRMSLFNCVVNSYKKLINQLDLITTVTIYTVVPLNSEQKQALQSKLEILTNSKVVELTIETKPELIGGFIVQIGSKIIDMSIYGQLNQISAHLNRLYL